MPTFILVKYPADLRNKVLDFSADLGQGESVVSASLVGPSPTGLTCSISSVATPMVTFTAGAGTDNTSYAADVVALTSQGRSITYTVAIAIDSQLAYTLQDQNPDAFNTLLGQLEAGQAALGVGAWAFPPSVDCTGGRITWDLIDQNGAVYSNGSAFTYKVFSSGVSNRVEGTALITAPSSMPPGLDGQKYQVRWALYLPGNATPTFSFENLRIVGPTSQPMGVPDVVEMATDNISLSIVLPRSYEHAGFQIYSGNNQIVAYIEASDKVRVADGWLMRGLIDPAALGGIDASTEPYTVIWSYWNSANANAKDKQSGRLFIVNPVLMMAAEDMRQMCNKARTTVTGEEDIMFTLPVLLSYLRRGRDAFNASYGMLTSFTMLGAAGGIREFWLMYSEMLALRSQFLAEGEKVFNYSGTAISLEVDRTSYYQTLADAIQGRIDAECKVFKMNLIKKGIIAGDGNLFGVGARPGSTGAIGISISPASSFGKLTPIFGFKGR